MAQHCEDWEECWRKDAIRNQEEALQLQAIVSIITIVLNLDMHPPSPNFAIPWLCSAQAAYTDVHRGQEALISTAVASLCAVKAYEKLSRKTTSA